jgi:hypothetical protein
MTKGRDPKPRVVRGKFAFRVQTYASSAYGPTIWAFKGSHLSPFISFPNRGFQGPSPLHLIGLIVVFRYLFIQWRAAH